MPETNHNVYDPLIHALVVRRNLLTLELTLTSKFNILKHLYYKALIRQLTKDINKKRKQKLISDAYLARKKENNNE